METEAERKPERRRRRRRSAFGRALALPLRHPFVTSLFVLPALAAMVLGLVKLTTPERLWPPEIGERFALCILYLDEDDRLNALLPSWDETAESIKEKFAALAKGGARFLLSADSQQTPVSWSDGGTFEYQIITPPARNPQVVRARCEMPGGALIATTYEAARDRLQPLIYYTGFSYVAVLWRLLAAIAVIALPVLFILGIPERQHEERRRRARRRYY